VGRTSPVGPLVPPIQGRHIIWPCLHYLKLFDESIMVLYCTASLVECAMVSTSSNLTRGIILIDNTNFMASAYTGGQGPSILTKENVNTLLNKVIESTTSGSRTVAGIGDYADNTSANSHANAYVYGLATCINQMLAEDCIRCHTSALDQFWLNLTTTRV
jgi:hypothetical protein